MEPNLILKERLFSGINLINRYYDNFIINSCVIFFIIMTIFILGIKKLHTQTKKQKLKNLKNFYSDIINYSN